ncbi:MAG: hypothetical protein WBG89_04985, partial [Ornithinimicrobium sp.]
GALAATTFGFVSSSDAVPDGPDDPDINDKLYSEIIQDESQFKSIEESDNTSTNAEFRVERGSVCTADSGGVIRFSSRWGYPQVHTNASHVAVGVSRAYVNTDGNVTIENTGGPVVSIVADPDETLTERGVSVGLSGGSGETIATFYSSKLGRALDLNRGTDWKQVYGTYSNLWVGFTHVVDC